jgi:hypothetical protein
MSDPIGGLPTYPPISSDRDLMNSETSSTSNIPVSDFRRNDARPIITDDGMYFILFVRSLLLYRYIYINMFIYFQRST